MTAGLDPEVISSLSRPSDPQVPPDVQWVVEWFDRHVRDAT